MRLTPLQVVGVLVALGVGGAVSYKYGRRSRKDREQIAALERDNAEAAEARSAKLDELNKMGESLKTGIAECDTVNGIRRKPPRCKNAAARGTIVKLLEGSLDRMMTAKSAAEMGPICQGILDDLGAAQKQCDS